MEKLFGFSISGFGDVMTEVPMKRRESSYKDSNSRLFFRKA